MIQEYPGYSGVERVLTLQFFMSPVSSGMTLLLTMPIQITPYHRGYPMSQGFKTVYVPLLYMGMVLTDKHNSCLQIKTPVSSGIAHYI